MTKPLAETPEQEVERLIGELDSLQEGGMAADMLAACGTRAIPYLADFLLKGAPRIISLPRCRAVHILGDLGARSVLTSYFKQYTHPTDPAVCFAEDAVRSAAAQELMRYPSGEVFRVLLDAAWQRATGGLVLALGKYQRPESVPLLFHILEDDLCREDAMNSLRKMPDAVRQFAILTVRGAAGLTLDGPADICRRRATLQLLSEVGVTFGDWPDLRRFLSADDPATVLAAAKVGLAVAREIEHSEIIAALLRASVKFNFVEEGEAEELLDAHPDIARHMARQIAGEKQTSGEKPRWSSPLWRLLHHTLGGVFETRKPRAS